MPVPDRREAVERQLLRDTAYEAIRHEIVVGTLAPGEVLHDAELCRWLALSRTPVRDALLRLRDEGLVEMAAQRYTRVAPLSRADVRDGFPVLAVVHGLATELAVPRMDAAQLAALQRENEAFAVALRSRDAIGAHAADERFHAVFVEASANGDIVGVLAGLAPRLHRLQHRFQEALPDRRSVAQHQAVVARAAAGDARGAAVAVRENWMTLGALFDRAVAESVPA